MRAGSKADLLQKIQALTRPSEFVPSSTTIDLDGAVVIQMLQPRNSRTFEEYIETMYIPMCMGS